MTTIPSRGRLAALTLVAAIVLGACGDAGVESVIGMSLSDGTIVEVTVETPGSLRTGDDEALLYTVRHTNPSTLGVSYAFGVAVEGCDIPGATGYDFAREGMGERTWPDTTYNLQPGHEGTSALQVTIPADCDQDLVLHAALVDPSPGGGRTVVEIPVRVRS